MFTGGGKHLEQVEWVMSLMANLKSHHRKRVVGSFA